MKKVLIVEDDSFLQGLAARRLTDDGFEVKTAADGETAITLLANEQFDAVLLDLMLPDMDGADVVKSIHEREVGKKIPILVFSNLSDTETIQKLQNLGVSDYLVKSNYTLDELSEKVKSFTA